MIDHNRGSAESDLHYRSGGSGGSSVSSFVGTGGGRRPIRDRLGPRPDENNRV